MCELLVNGSYVSFVCNIVRLPKQNKTCSFCYFQASHWGAERRGRRILFVGSWHKCHVNFVYFCFNKVIVKNGTVCGHDVIIIKLHFNRLVCKHEYYLRFIHFIYISDLRNIKHHFEGYEKHMKDLLRRVNGTGTCSISLNILINVQKIDFSLNNSWFDYKA